jgi:hypothetical protein
MSLRSGGPRRLFANRSLRPRPLADWTLLGLFGVGLTGVVLSVVGGVSGVVLAVALAVVWGFFPPVYSYALGHVLALGTTARALTVVELLFVELGLLAVLFGPLTRAEVRDRGPIGRSTLGFGFALGGVVVVGLALQNALWPVSVLLVLCGLGLLYGLHRYELVALGLVDDDEDGTTDVSTPGDGLPTAPTAPADVDAREESPTNGTAGGGAG